MQETTLHSVKRHIHVSPTQFIVLGFLSVILIGALLLQAPAASAAPGRAPFMTALFTAVSSTCVTGLIVVDTATYWTPLGQSVILLLVQIGGLGFMMLAVSMSMLLKRKISPRARLLIAQSLNLSSPSGVIRLARRIIFGTFLFETAGALFLMIRFVPLFGPEGIWKAVFTSVSAFCNAGFDLMGTFSGRFSSLTYFRSDPLVCLTVSALIIIGGIGFVVWDDLYELIAHRKRLSVYTRFVMLVTACLILSGFAATCFFDWSNPALGSSAGEKLLSALFQSVTTRTAGFNTVDIGALSKPTQFIYCGLMFVGGASGSTAGGVKVGTFGLILLALFRVALGETRVNIFKRHIRNETVLRAFTVAGLQLAISLFGVVFLLAYDFPFIDAMFESFSATGTVGLSLSLTPTLAPPALIVLMAEMFFGRVGILTFTYAVMVKLAAESRTAEFASTEMLIG